MENLICLDNDPGMWFHNWIHEIQSEGYIYCHEKNVSAQQYQESANPRLQGQDENQGGHPGSQEKKSQREKTANRLSRLSTLPFHGSFFFSQKRKAIESRGLCQLASVRGAVCHRTLSRYAKMERAGFHEAGAHCREEGRQGGQKESNQAADQGMFSAQQAQIPSGIRYRSQRKEECRLFGSSKNRRGPGKTLSSKEISSIEFDTYRLSSSLSTSRAFRLFCLLPVDSTPPVPRTPGRPSSNMVC